MKRICVSLLFFIFIVGFCASLREALLCELERLSQEYSQIIIF